MTPEFARDLVLNLVYAPGPPEVYSLPSDPDVVIALTQPDTTPVRDWATGGEVPMQTLAFWAANGEPIDPHALSMARYRYNHV